MARIPATEHAMLVDLVGQIERLEARPERWQIAPPGSSLAGDDTVMAPLQTSHLVGHALSAAVDHLRGVRMLLIDESKPGKSVRLLMVAHYPLVRSALECGALAAWLLRPDDQRTRLIRSLQARWSEIAFEHQMIQAMTEPDLGDDKATISRKQKGRRENTRPHGARKRRARAIASSLNVSDEELFAFPGFGPIVADAMIDGPTAPSTARGTWNMLSGLTHPSVTRMVSVSEMEIVSTTGDTQHALFTTKPSTLIGALIAALMMIDRGEDLLRMRGTVS